VIRAGFKNLDALHVASAEQSRCDVLSTCDDRLLAAATRNANTIHVRVLAIAALALEVLK
jgi:predicted nucleic acid-binding protein